MKPFKNRKIDYEKPVSIYRNLNCKRGKVDYSIKQGKYVVGHTSSVTLRDVEFKISKAGQLRARKSGIRNVHAFASGYIDLGTMYFLEDVIKIKYNPFETNYFMSIKNEKPVHDANLGIFNKEGVFVIK